MIGRVLHLSDYGGPYTGSFIPMLRASAAAARANGWSCEFAFTPVAAKQAWFNELAEEDVLLHVHDARDTSAALDWLERWIDGSEGFTVLHTHFSAWDRLAVRARRPSTAVFWHLHSRLYDSLSARVRNTVRFATYGRHVERVLCVGPDIYTKARARLAPRERTLLFPNGIDLRRFTPVTDDERRAARVALDLPSDQAVLMLFGWDWATKGGDLFLAASAELAGSGRRVVAVPIGGEVKARAAAARLGIDGAVLPRPPADDVRALYAAADVFVAASPDEGLGLAPLESLASGTPVVASDVPGHRYFGSQLAACRLAPLDTRGFAAAIAAELDADPADRARRLAESRHYIEQNASVDDWARRLTSLYVEAGERRR